MQNYIIERVEEIANYIIREKSTLRDTANMTVRLPQIDPEKYDKVREVLDINLAERHIRGGHSTQLKYSQH